MATDKEKRAKTWPSYNLYPGDYMRAVISSCSPMTQFVWLRMEMVMHDCEPYGHLSINNSPMPSEMVARRLGITLAEYKDALKEMKEVGWLKTTEANMIYSENLVSQQGGRVKASEKKKNQRERRRNQGGGSDSFFDDPSEYQQDNQNDVPPRVPANVPRDNLSLSPSLHGSGNGSGNGTGSSISSLERGAGENLSSPSPPVSPLSSPLTDEEAYAFGLAPDLPAPTPPEYAAAVAVERDTGPEEAPHLRHTDAIVNEIILATPTAKALRWSLLVVRNMPILRAPVVEAIRAEAADRGEGTQEAARFMLANVTRITELVQEEAGWEKFWPKSRFDKFFKQFGYRNPEIYNRAGGDHGASNGSRGKASGNDAVLQRVLEKAAGRRMAAGQGSDGSDAHAPVSGDPRQAPERHDHRGVQRISGGAERRGAGDGVRKSPSGTEVLSQPRGASRAMWPENA